MRRLSRRLSKNSARDTGNLYSSNTKLPKPMRTTPEERAEVIERLARLGIGFDDAKALRRIAMTLHRWAELECGFEHGGIERDEVSGLPYWVSSATNKRWRIPDRESGAFKRLSAILARYPELVSYHQTDPRGAALYILRRENLADGANVESVYASCGIAVY